MIQKHMIKKKYVATWGISWGIKAWRDPCICHIVRGGKWSTSMLADLASGDEETETMNVVS